MPRPIRWLLALAAPLMLASCIITPAKFTSSLDVRADRSFTFTYVGEVLLMKTKAPSGLDPAGDGDQDNADPGGDDEPAMYEIAVKSGKGAKAPVEKPDPLFGDTQAEATRLQQLAAALSKEYGYRSVRYIGNRKLAIDYRISGKLDHAFVFPFNPDGDVVLPFIAIELRGKDRVRIKAPGYANEQSLAAMGNAGGMGGLDEDESDSALDGTFTLITNAAIVSQNQEDGAATQPDGAKKILWRATPQTRDAPMAVLKVDPLPEP